jgi:phage repressor protein C with HTH and peptisase S24 domain
MQQKPPGNAPEWSRKILAFRQTLKLTQAELAERLTATAMTVSRWERGEGEPSAEAYIRLGNMAGDPLCWFFWGRAGLRSADLLQALPSSRKRWRMSKIPDVQIVQPGAEGAFSISPGSFVAIPILPVQVATSGVEGEPVADLDQLKPEAIWAAPTEWVPNPEATVSFRVKGNSMSPQILDGYIVAVDTSDVPRETLVGQIVVAWHATNKRLLLSRLIRIDHTEILVSDHREYQSFSLASGSPWRILGRVLWWIGRPL